MSQTETFVTHGFGPFFRQDSRYLILGSFPSVRSREASFYYAHPQNRFWKILAAIFDDTVPVSTEEKKAFLIRHRIALYDVIESCRITGSSDSSIRDVTVTDLMPVLAVPRRGADLCQRDAGLGSVPALAISADRNRCREASLIIACKCSLDASASD